MASYCAGLKAELYFPWCGVAVAYCLAKARIRPIFNAGDYHRFAYAPAWLDWGSPVEDGPEPGDVVVFGRDGLEHVTFFVAEADADHWDCLGGNQGPEHKVVLRRFPKAAVAGVRRAPAAQVSSHIADDDLRNEPPPPHEAWSQDPGIALPLSVAGLPPEFILLAQSSQRKWGVPASVTLAQAILESAGGRKMPPNSFNPFGITTTGKKRGVSARTQEEIGGVRQTMTRSFRVYGSFAEAFDDHGQLLHDHYPEAMRFKDDALQFAQNLKRYATASNYTSSLQALIKKYNLRQFDVAEQGGDVTMEGANLSVGSTGAMVTALQQNLNDLGYWTGGVDGTFGTFTQGAVLQFQTENGLEVDGVAGPDVFEALKRALPRSLPRARTDATAADLAKWGSTIIQNSTKTQWAGVLSAILGVLGIGNSIAVNFGAGQTAASNPATSPDLANAISKGVDVAKQILNTNKALSPDQSKEILNIVQLLSDNAKTASQHTGAPVNNVLEMAANSPEVQGLVHTGIQSLATVLGSAIPPFGGSLLALGFGLLTHYLGSQIKQARTDDHNTGVNIKSLPNRTRATS